MCSALHATAPKTYLDIINSFAYSIHHEERIIQVLLRTPSKKNIKKQTNRLLYFLLRNIIYVHEACQTLCFTCRKQSCSPGYTQSCSSRLWIIDKPNCHTNCLIYMVLQIDWRQQVFLCGRCLRVHMHCHIYIHILLIKRSREETSWGHGCTPTQKKSV